MSMGDWRRPLSHRSALHVAEKSIGGMSIYFCATMDSSYRVVAKHSKHGVTQHHLFDTQEWDQAVDASWYGPC